MRAKKKVAYHPQFKGPVEGYVVNFLRTNSWRAMRSMEHADLMQEAGLVFAKLAQRYPEVDTPQHFMALFKTAWFNHFTDLANKDTKMRVAMLDCDLEHDHQNYLASLPGDLFHDGMLRIAIRQAPAEVQSVLALFLNAPTELLELVMQSWSTKDQNHDNGNTMLCQMLGIEPGTDVVRMVEDYFSPYN